MAFWRRCRMSKDVPSRSKHSASDDGPMGGSPSLIHGLALMAAVLSLALLISLLLPFSGLRERIGMQYALYNPYVKVALSA